MEQSSTVVGWVFEGLLKARGSCYRTLRAPLQLLCMLEMAGELGRPCGYRDMSLDSEDGSRREAAMVNVGRERRKRSKAREPWASPSSRCRLHARTARGVQARHGANDVVSPSPVGARGGLQMKVNPLSSGRIEG